MECWISSIAFDGTSSDSNFSASHWSRHGSLVSISQQFVTTRVVHLSKRPKQAYLLNQTEAELQKLILL